MKRLVSVIALLFAAALAQGAGNQYYVATNGVANAAGTVAAPWTLLCAFAGTCGPGANKPAPGDIVYVRGGTYFGNHGVAGAPVFPVTVQGTAGNQIELRNYFGEHAILDCQTEVDYIVPGPCLGYKGATQFTTIRGLEMGFFTAGPNGAAAPRRTATLPGTNADQNYGNIVEFQEDSILKPGHILIGNYIHDGYTGVYGAHEAVNPIIYGNWIMNTGTAGPRGYVTNIPVSNGSSGCAQYSPTTDYPDANSNIIKYPTGTVSGTGGTPATFYAFFNNGFPVKMYVNNGGSPTGTLTCTMPTVTGGSGAGCLVTQDATSHAILAVRPDPANMGNGNYLSTKVVGNGVNAYGTAFGFSGSTLTTISTQQPAAGDLGVGNGFCTNPTGDCTPAPPTFTIVGNCSGAVIGTPTVLAQDRGHAHVFYLKNDLATKYVMNNIITNGHQYGIQIFVTTPTSTQSVRGFWLEKNIIQSFNGLAAGAPMTIAGDTSQRVTMIDNLIYGVGTAYGGAQGVSPFACADIGTSTFTGNVLWSKGDWAGEAPSAGGQLLPFLNTVWGGATAALKNLFVGAFYPSPQFFNAYPNNTYYRGDTGADGTAGYPTTNPAPRVYPNIFMKGRCHVGIYNPQLLSTVNVDISSCVPTGEQYDIRSGEDPLNAILTGTCTPNCTSVAFPMTGTRVAAPIDEPKLPLTTRPDFGSFIVNVANLTGDTYGIVPTCPAITLAPVTLAGGTVGTAYNQTITASGATAPYTFAIAGGALPTSLVISTGGVISGTPTVAGTFSFIATATDANNCLGSRSYSITILPASCPTITVTPTTLPSGTVNAAYSQTLSASGGTSPYTWSASGVVPTGLTLSSGGVLSGTPTAAGTFNFTATATDAAACTGNQSYAVVISPVVSGSSLATRTFVIYNGTAGPMTSSKAIADYYVAQRGIPAVNEWSYSFPDEKVITGAQYATFKTALQSYLNTTQAADLSFLKDKILYIVYVYRTPYYVTNSGIVGPAGLTATAMDSFVSDLYGEAPTWITNSKANPYSAVVINTSVVVEPVPPTAFQSLAAYRDGGGNHVYSTWRIDAPTQAQAQKIIDDSIFAEQNGLHGLFRFGTCGAQGGTRCGYDPCGGVNCFWRVAADMLYNASQIAASSPKIGSARVVVDYDTGGTNPPTPANPDGEFLYGDGYRNVFTWNRGAFGCSWRSAPFLGYSDGTGGVRAGVAFALLNDPQAWSVAAIDKGVVLSIGPGDEGTTQALPAQDVAWRALVGNQAQGIPGANMGDAWFRAVKVINWQTYFVGDPLYTPFP